MCLDFKYPLTVALAKIKIIDISYQIDLNQFFTIFFCCYFFSFLVRNTYAWVAPIFVASFLFPTSFTSVMRVFSVFSRRISFGFSGR